MTVNIYVLIDPRTLKVRFTSLKEVCELYNWDRKKYGYEAKFSKKFYKHFPTSTLTISPHKIS